MAAAPRPLDVLFSIRFAQHSAACAETEELQTMAAASLVAARWYL